MGCGASKVSNQTISPVESENLNENKSKAINNVLTSTQNTSSPNISDSSNINTQTPSSTTDSKNENQTQPTSSSNANEKEVSHQLKKSSSTPLAVDKSNKKSESLFKSKSRVSLLDPLNKNDDINKSTETLRIINDSSLYSKNKNNSSNNLLNSNYGSNEKKGLSQSSSEATLTNQNSSDSIGKLSLTSSFTPLPAIEQKTTLKSISFEIPLDESMICKTVRPSFKGSLPKLHISQDEIKRKIGNVDSKWRDINVTKNGYKKKGPVDEEKLKALKKRLLEKEAEAAMNRQRELDKLKAKLEKAQKHALKVQERKRKLEAEWMAKRLNV
ncbi:hypothetical protein BCR32DRAFT_249379 [Anaeromyces robustus]|uniref:Uncharacterized protein n=1 Tax=Anaeromyces robustus TaxID=1754192 RepID=A0A1Y1WQ69_9FUNG|nr:hypothetical protein BCR32DRAFT_249379 [Anaeromyces robustus]|eukprot:ORX75673.1 hypothetical protein BCR32DRAFT_249379 [Anaeromyces robustus]